MLLDVGVSIKGATLRENLRIARLQVLRDALLSDEVLVHAAVGSVDLAAHAVDVDALGELEVEFTRRWR